MLSNVRNLNYASIIITVLAVMEKKKYTGAFWGFYFWKIREKTVS